MSGAKLIYDDDCGFCTWSARWVADRSDIELVGFSQLDDELRERLPEDYEDCAHLVDGEDRYSCGEAMEEAFARTNVGKPTRPALDFLRNFEEYGDIREFGYDVVRENRSLFGTVLSAEPPGRESDG